MKFTVLLLALVAFAGLLQGADARLSGSPWDEGNSLPKCSGSWVMCCVRRNDAGRCLRMQKLCQMPGRGRSCKSLPQRQPHDEMDDEEVGFERPPHTRPQQPTGQSIWNSMWDETNDKEDCFENCRDRGLSRRSCKRSCRGSRDDDDTAEAPEQPEPTGPPGGDDDDDEMEDEEVGANGSDIPRPNAKYSCKKQALWGKCSMSWMKGSCCSSCPNNCRRRHDEMDDEEDCFENCRDLGLSRRSCKHRCNHPIIRN